MHILIVLYTIDARAMCKVSCKYSLNIAFSSLNK